MYLSLGNKKESVSFKEALFKGLASDKSLYYPVEVKKLDDYFWKGYAKIEENPAFAINQFLKEVNNKYEVANFSKYQLFLRKLN